MSEVEGGTSHLLGSSSGLWCAELHISIMSLPVPAVDTQPHQHRLQARLVPEPQHVTAAAAAAAAVAASIRIAFRIACGITFSNTLGTS